MLKIQSKIIDLQLIFSLQNIKLTLKEIFESGIVEDDVIALIQNRLYKQGTDSEGEFLKTDKSKGNPYSDFTMELKGLKEQRISNVTLKDSGEFHDSFEGDLQGDDFIMTADFIKDEHIFTNFELSYQTESDFEQKILNLTKEQKADYIIKELIPEILLYLQSQIKEIA
jgi:hypothetical protein